LFTRRQNLCGAGAVVRWRNRFDEPIDFALLAAERRGYRHTPETLKRIKATRAKNRKARARVAAKRTEERLSEARAPRRGTPGAGQRFLDAFERGKWYGVSDIETRAGIKRGVPKPTRLSFESLVGLSGQKTRPSRGRVVWNVSFCFGGSGGITGI
jgi:hypothetical protein